MKPIYEFNDFLKKKWKSSIVHEKKRFEFWKFSFPLKKCDTLGMSKMCQLGYVYCSRISQNNTLVETEEFHEKEMIALTKFPSKNIFELKII